jgi:four helix bundle protein
VKIVKKIPDHSIGRDYSDQLLRSGTSAALNYGEAQSAESRKDFIHKMKISLKELRETFICLKIIKEAQICVADDMLCSAINENGQLIGIFIKSVQTAHINLIREKNQSKTS